MNEKIRELAEQAGLLGPSSRVGNAHEATEKFAELIVKECAGIAERPHEYIKTESGNQIRKHFGVEE